MVRHLDCDRQVAFVIPPAKLLTQNSELRKDKIWNWSLPAHVVTLSDGSRFNVCPNAGSCGRVCYAKFGTYVFSNVRGRHIINLEYTLLEPDSWQAQMGNELSHKRFNPSGEPRIIKGLPIWGTEDDWLNFWMHIGGAAVRIHDGGDFYSQDYLLRWLKLAQKFPRILFYCYTKEITMFRESVEFMPANFRYVFSFGGKQDSLINRETDRHADVFATQDDLEAAGYFNQGENDLLAVCAPSNKIGIVANNLPVAKKRFAGRRMSELGAS